MAAPALQESGELLNAAAMDLVDFSNAERPGRRHRRDTRPPQNLIDQHVPEAGHGALIEQDRFEVAVCPSERAGEFGWCDHQQIRAEGVRVGVGEEPAPATRVVDPEATTITERHRDPIPFSAVIARRVFETFDRCMVVDDEPTGHPEMQAEGHSVGLDHQQFADPDRSGDDSTDQRWVHTAGGTPIIDPDLTDLAADGGLGDTSVDLDLEALGHRSSLAHRHRVEVIATDARDAATASGDDRTATDQRRARRRCDDETVIALSWLNFLSAMVFLGALVGLLFAVRRLEPHWVSGDGLRFIAPAEQVDSHGLAEGRRSEYRFSIELDGTVWAMRRAMIGYRPKTAWRAEGRSDSPPARREVFLLRSVDDRATLLAVRLPSTSRAVPALTALLDDAEPLTDPD